MEAFPFQSNFMGMDEQGNPQYDRAVGADFIHARERLFYKDGVFANPSTNFQVVASSGMVASVNPGACFIQGVTGIEINNTPLTIEPAEELVNRVDIVVLRASFVNRLVEVAVKKGTTQLTRNGNIWELKIAEVTVPKLATSITQANILDTRLNTTVCGVVTGAVDQVDTTTIFNQYQDFWNTIYQQMGANIGQFSSGFNMYGAATGTGSYAVDIPGAILVEGANFKIKFVNGFTGQSSLNINGQGAKNITRADGTPFNIKAGSVQNLIYVNGNFLPVGEGGCGNATASDVKQGVTFSNDEGFFEGAMPENSRIASTLTTQNQQIAVPAGYYPTDGYVKATFANLVDSNIVKGVTVGGVPGSFISGKASTFSTYSDLKNKTSTVNMMWVTKTVSRPIQNIVFYGIYNNNYINADITLGYAVNTTGFVTGINYYNQTQVGWAGDGNTELYIQMVSDNTVKVGYKISNGTGQTYSTMFQIAY